MTPPLSNEQADFKVREEITPNDRHLIFNLITNSGFFRPREMAYGMDLFDEHLIRGEISHYQFMLHEKDRQLLAYGCYGPIKLGDRRFQLHWLAVENAHQGHGLGHLLEAAITNKIRVQGGLKIYAEISNRDYHAPVRVFYESCGYRLAAAIADYYADGDDKVIYVKDL